MKHMKLVFNVGSGMLVTDSELKSLQFVAFVNIQGVTISIMTNLPTCLQNS